MPPKDRNPKFNFSSEERAHLMEFIKMMEKELDRAERELDNIQKSFQVLTSPNAKVTVCLN